MPWVREFPHSGPVRCRFHPDFVFALALTYNGSVEKSRLIFKRLKMIFWTCKTKSDGMSWTEHTSQVAEACARWMNDFDIDSPERLKLCSDAFRLTFCDAIFDRAHILNSFVPSLCNLPRCNSLPFILLLFLNPTDGITESKNVKILFLCERAFLC